MYETLISCEEAAKHLKDPNWVFVDCRFQLSDKNQGLNDFLEEHIPGAVYADLEKDLSGEIIPGQTGRHPLPSKEKLAEALTRLGISNVNQVLVYDNQAGQMAAARLWWLLKWAGHQAVALLDGGLQQWLMQELPVESGENQNAPGNFRPSFNDRLLFSAEEVLNNLENPEFRLVDSRSADRYRGENETVDPVAGHIPGAISLPHGENIASDGTMKSASELQARFKKSLESVPEENTVFYCGSGVTATQNILAYVCTGRKMPRLYLGSWSDWITNPKRPIRTGSSA